MKGDLFAAEKLVRAEVVSVKRTRNGSWAIVIRCPYCSRLHDHGGGKGLAPYFGTRVSHCIDRPGREYELDPAGQA